MHWQWFICNWNFRLFWNFFVVFLLLKTESPLSKKENSQWFICNWNFRLFWNFFVVFLSLKTENPLCIKENSQTFLNAGKREIKPVSAARLGIEMTKIRWIFLLKNIISCYFHLYQGKPSSLAKKKQYFMWQWYTICILIFLSLRFLT